jgi:hypothetical protein
MVVDLPVLFVLSEDLQPLDEQLCEKFDASSELVGTPGAEATGLARRASLTLRATMGWSRHLS